MNKSLPQQIQTSQDIPNNQDQGVQGEVKQNSSRRDIEKYRKQTQDRRRAVLMQEYETGNGGENQKVSQVGPKLYTPTSNGCRIKVSRTREEQQLIKDVSQGKQKQLQLNTGRSFYKERTLAAQAQFQEGQCSKAFLRRDYDYYLQTAPIRWRGETQKKGTKRYAKRSQGSQGSRYGTRLTNDQRRRGDVPVQHAHPLRQVNKTKVTKEGQKRAEWLLYKKEQEEADVRREQVQKKSERGDRVRRDILESRMLYRFIQRIEQDAKKESVLIEEPVDYGAQQQKRRGRESQPYEMELREKMKRDASGKIKTYKISDTTIL